MSRPRVVIVGAGFAGYRAARTLARLTRGRARVTLLNPTDYFLYLPLLPQVSAGILEARRVTVSLPGTLRGVRLVLGEADRVDLDRRTVRYTDPEGGTGSLGYDRLVLAVGSVNKLLPIPGVAEHAHGFRGLPEALYLRDHVTRQVELAAAADDPAERAARCTFVVVGAGYTGTEVAAQMQMLTDRLARRHLPGGARPRWMLLDIAPRVLPEMDERLSRTADRVLRARGVDVRMGTSVEEATHDGVLLTDGESVRCRTLVWCVGVRPDPLVEAVGQPLERGRLIVDPHLRVPGREEVFACGDAAAVPDLEHPGKFTPMTAQHAWRQGRVAGENVAASLGLGRRRRVYRHRDLGFVVDLGGVRAAANPLGIPLSGLPAGAVTRGYHLAAMPGNRVRVLADWILDAVLPRQGVQLGLVRSWSVPLDTSSPELARVPRGPAAAAPTDDTPAAARPTPTEPRTPTPPPKPHQNTEPGGSGPSGEPPRNRAGGEPPQNRPGGERAVTEPGSEPAKPQPGGEPARNQPGGEPARNQPGGEPARNQPGGEPAKNQPGGEPAKNQPFGGAAKSEPDSGAAKTQPGGERAMTEPGSEPAKPQPGGGPARNQPGGEPARNETGGEPARNQPGGEPARNETGGEPARNQPGGEPARNQPG
ncbi:FAD-dependent oxidoreductase, partial [Streptomyces bungoensis]|uniref:FAD-dependent oxidoreductase n=1 Tax=Streptomyces bungoensis TaxID=285568 RepID=UPI001FCA3009